jgi:hypothetical protein
MHENGVAGNDAEHDRGELEGQRGSVGGEQPSEEVVDQQVVDGPNRRRREAVPLFSFRVATAKRQAVGRVGEEPGQTGMGQPVRGPTTTEAARWSPPPPSFSEERLGNSPVIDGPRAIQRFIAPPLATAAAAVRLFFFFSSVGHGVQQRV